MFESTLSVVALVPLLLAGCWCFYRSIKNWQSGLHLLIVALMFGGITSVVAANGAAAIAFRDIFIVLPLYMGFLVSRVGVHALLHLPLDIALGLFVIMSYVCIGILNPVTAPPFQLLIGLKVWLFYLPFVLVGIALALRPETLFRTLRFFLVLGLVPVATGLLQALLVRTMGYEPAIGLFFGKAAENATQGFGFYDEAGGIYRIPSTFSFVSQYVEFLYLYLTIAVVEMNADPDSRFRRIGELALFATLMAGIFSGTRGALLTFPGLIAIYACFGLLSSRLLLVSPAAVAIGLWIISLAGIDLFAFFIYGRDITANYTQNWVMQQISDAINNGGIFGAGIGSSTVAVRYANAGFAEGMGSTFGYESYFAKIAAELGFIGLAIFTVFLVGIALRSLFHAFSTAFTPSNRLIAPFAIYILFNLGYSFKGYVLDTDPSNIFFWISLGIIVQVHRGFLAPVPALSAGTPPDLAAGAPAVANIRSSLS